MAVYIKTKDGIKRVSNEDITKAEIEKGLGYTPSDFSGKYSDIEDAPDIKDDGSGVFYIVDANGNVILKVDSEGLHTTDIELDGIPSVKDKLENADSLTDDSDTLYVVDGEGHIIAKIDKDGIHTVELYLGNEPLSEKLKNILTSITEEAEDRLVICDEDGNIICQIDAKGVDTVAYYLNGKEVNFLTKEYKEYLDKQLYQKPTTLLNLTFSTSVDTSIEVGTKIVLSNFAHKETNVNNINGNLTFYKDSTVILSTVAPSETLKSVTVNAEHTFVSDKAVTFKLQGKDTMGNTFSAQKSYSSYFPSYYGSLTTDTVDVSKLTKKKSTNVQGVYNIKVETDGYIYFCCYSGSKAITAITSGGFAVPFEKLSDIQVVLGGDSYTYSVYRTSNKIQADENEYELTVT